MWPTVNRNAPRIMQATKDQDFTIDIKFNSIPSQRYQIQGLLVEQDANNWLRFDISSDGNSLKMFAGGIVGGSTVSKPTNIPAGGSEIYMRVSRVGNNWTQSYSYDGATWKSPQSFTQALAVGSTGIFAATEPQSGAPAWMLEAEYFLNTAFPVGNTGYILSTNVVGDGSIQLSPEPDINGSYGCNQTVSLTAVPTPGESFTGWSGALTGISNPATVTMNSNKTVTAYFGAEPGEVPCLRAGTNPGSNGICMPIVLSQ
jgi:regulation of enolase protein 1 (concanavalin A-like superfamily)